MQAFAPAFRRVSQRDGCGKIFLLHPVQKLIKLPDGAVFKALQQEVIVLLSVAGNTEYMHSIANLALLNTADNAALNNSTFDVKRNDILKMDRAGQYIPFCTKMVFLKYYTPSQHTDLHFWGQADRLAYIGAINTVLASYLDEPITLEKEGTQ